MKYYLCTKDTTAKCSIHCTDWGILTNQVSQKYLSKSLPKLKPTLKPIWKYNSFKKQF